MTQEIDSDLSRLVTQNDVEINLEFLKKNKEKIKEKLIDPLLLGTYIII